MCQSPSSYARGLPAAERHICQVKSSRDVHGLFKRDGPNSRRAKRSGSSHLSNHKVPRIRPDTSALLNITDITYITDIETASHGMFAKGSRDYFLKLTALLIISRISQTSASNGCNFLPRFPTSVLWTERRLLEAFLMISRQPQTRTSNSLPGFPTPVF